MAQAARLSMRMQKELKLLLSDPPHGASFPHLSSAASGSGDLSTFSTIDAQIEGPGDTVYANGIFNLKIQIPERYPFQPPIVAFATPIYHPNIDNSGRICLDILNLPPKGAWQPSLNISTVLTSIGLLLSEPNPDDGLMCDVSREYKYNRQTFDYKAREMTEKYAKVKADGGSSSLQIKIHGDKKLSEPGTSVLASNQEKTTLTENHKTASQGVPNSQLLLSSSIDKQEDQNGKRKAMTGSNEVNTFPNDGTKPNRKKLSLAMSSQSQNKDLSTKEFTNVASASCKENKKFSLGLKQPLDNNRLSRKLSLRSLGESKVNEVSKNIAESDMGQEMNQDQDLRSCCGEVEDSGLEKASMSESIVVLDSDDSGEEDAVSTRSRLSLARRSVRYRR